MMVGTNKWAEETWKRVPPDSVGVELGVWKGDTSEKFLNRASHLHLVDSWAIESYQSDTGEHGDYQAYLTRYAKIVGSRDPKKFQQYYNKIHQSVIKRFADKPVTIHRCTTDEFFTTFAEIVDWVYVDASHSFEGCLSDLENCLKIVKFGGTIYGDDYGDAKPGVKKAVDTFVETRGLELNNFFKTQYEIKI